VLEEGKLTLSCSPRSDGKGLSVQNEGGKLVAVLTDHGAYGPFELCDPSGALLLRGRKRHSFMYSRWWDAADEEGVRQLTMRLGQFRTKRADIVLADERELSIQAVGKPPAGRILAGDGGRTLAEITDAGDGKLQIAAEELSTIELLGAVGLWRLAHSYSSAAGQAGQAANASAGF